MWAALAIATASTVGLVWWKRRARRVYLIDHVKLEMHPPCVVEDRVVEQLWRAAISMTNTSRRPRLVPVLAERATVRTGRSVFLANVYLDSDVHELNPREVALVWIELVLPRDTNACTVTTTHLRRTVQARALRWAARAEQVQSRIVSVDEVSYRQGFRGIAQPPR